MPAKYVAIRDHLIAEGKGEAAAKTSAAKIINATRKPGEAPVTNHGEGDRASRLASTLKRMKGKKS
jgi:hypothetical protein